MEVPLISGTPVGAERGRQCGRGQRGRPGGAGATRHPSAARLPLRREARGEGGIRRSRPGAFPMNGRRGGPPLGGGGGGAAALGEGEGRPDRIGKRPIGRAGSSPAWLRRHAVHRAIYILAVRRRGRGGRKNGGPPTFPSPSPCGRAKRQRTSRGGGSFWRSIQPTGKHRRRRGGVGERIRRSGKPTIMRHVTGRVGRRKRGGRGKRRDGTTPCEEGRRGRVR